MINGKDEPDDKIVTLDRHLIVAHPSQLPPPKEPDARTIVLDLDETLVSVCRRRNPLNDYPIYLRPDTRWLLEELRNRDFELIVWSAGTRSHVSRCLDKIDPECELITAAVCWDESWVRPHLILKDLGLLPGRELERCWLIENSPLTAIDQTERVIIVPPYTYTNRNDQTLRHLFELIDSCLVNGRGPLSAGLSLRQHLVVIDRSRPCHQEECRLSRSLAKSEGEYSLLVVPYQQLYVPFPPYPFG
jgi:hypothetical protein